MTSTLYLNSDPTIAKSLTSELSTVPVDQRKLELQLELPDHMTLRIGIVQTIIRKSEISLQLNLSSDRFDPPCLEIFM